MVDAQDPMFAPRRVPPCLIASVAALKTSMKEIGPLETPLVDCTTSFFGRRRENENPVPPPLLWISAVCLIVSKMLSIESSIGSTKQRRAARAPARVHQRGRVRQELEVGHHAVILLFPVPHRLRLAVEPLRRGYIVRDPPEQLLRRFRQFPSSSLRR